VPRGGPSIDHAMWFHDSIAVDDWVLLEMWPLKAGGSRGLYTGEIRDEVGRLGAVLNQEILFRIPKGIPIVPIERA
jgi:acyl-CoA thioesterase-2